METSYNANGPPSPRIVTNLRALLHDWTPHPLLHRTEQMEKLSFHLRMFARSGVPGHFILHGPPGTGKTLTVRSLLPALQRENPDLRVAVICCREREMENFAAIARSVGVNMGRGWGFGEIWEKVRESLGDSPFLVVLDEFDKASRHNEFLFSLLDHPKVCLVGAANDLSFYRHIDDGRILSRLNATSIHFPPYTPSQLTDILKQRAEAGLAPGSWDEGLLSLCAALTSSSFRGNARYAVDLLRASAFRAEEKGKKRIEEEDVREAHGALSEEELLSPLKELSRVELVYLYALASRPGATIREVKGFGDELASRLGLNFSPTTGATAFRRFYSLNLARFERKGRGRGKGVDHYVHPLLPPEKVKRRIATILGLDHEVS
ncbi:MAG: AAA family ATPase [Candidatus Hadarchaeales archaeon]